MGVAIINANNTMYKKSLDNRPTILLAVAPKILRTLISFIRLSAANAARPNNPRHEMMIANSVNDLVRQRKEKL